MRGRAINVVFFLVKVHTYVHKSISMDRIARAPAPEHVRRRVRVKLTKRTHRPYGSILSF